MDPLPAAEGPGPPYWRGIPQLNPPQGREPKKSDTVDARSPRPARTRVSASCRRRVLIVDDDEAVRETLAELLDLAGFATLLAADAADAVAILRRDHEIAALVTDLTMPGDDGITLIRVARTIRCAIPAILLTGYAEEVASISTIAGGNFHVLRKPVESDRLIDQLELLWAACPGT